jgi:hypothetical protein
MSRIIWIFGIIVVAIIAIMLFLFFSTPYQADYYDNFTEDIGGDGFLVANLTHALKTGEENISDGSFNASTGEYKYFGAKNISYIDYVGARNYIVVWKTTPDKYNFFNTKNNVNQYVSDYSKNSDEKCFIEYSYENNAVYGIIIGSQNNITFKESELMYEILGLNEDGFDLVYTAKSPSYSYGSSSGSHYHTVVPDRYTLSRSDPGAYYDHYEYGDNYDIDDYLESQGYD